jgi:hypothetical protein
VDGRYSDIVHVGCVYSIGDKKAGKEGKAWG